ncbi:MAG: PQQ-like beta-propeller repeat protein [Deltaproteobacteria bacterium]|nr:PQQ-like beta-propeller repeat protein [Deltaproteobacteria bacterium]
MAERFAPARFPRGVADASRGRAFLRDQSGALVALDLTTGNVLWRTTVPMRPLLVCDGKVLAVRLAARHTLEVVILDAADGRELRISKPLIFPEWANVSLEDTTDFTLRVETKDGAVFLRWAARSRYRGGAAPSIKVLEAARRDAWGEARVDVDTGEVEELPGAVGDVPEAPSEEAPSSLSPDVLEQRDIGNKSFQLLTRNTAGGTVQMLVRAVHPDTGQVAWETIVDEVPVRRPKPPRP